MPHDEFVPEDPMELVGMAIPGEAGTLELMAEAIVDEYIRLGWEEGRLLTLFTNPIFQATYRIYLQKGESYVQDLIRTTRSKYKLCAPQKESPHA